VCRQAVLALLALLVFAGPSVAQRALTWRDDVSAYYAAVARDDEREMLRTALRLAEAHKGAYWATIVGDLYWRGRGIAPDPAEAVKWYRRAAVRGGELAMLALARAHHAGKGADRDAEAVNFWLSQAASRRQPRAILEGAIYLRRGMPYPRDKLLAEHQIDRGLDLLYERARFEEETNVDAMPARRAAYVRAFRIFACPWAAPPDEDQALRFLMLATAEGWLDGALQLARLGTAHPALWSRCARN
jgi:TPR repeat protein